MSEVQRKLASVGVYAGLHGLEGLFEASAFWDEQAYGTRLYFGPGGGQYLHRSVLGAAIALLKEPHLEPINQELFAALKELVECKNMKDRLGAYEAGSTQELSAMLDDYNLRKPRAWDAARALVAKAAASPPAHPVGEVQS